MKMLKFGTDGWRAVLAEEFTFSNARVVAQAIASYIEKAGLKARGILIGHDTRFLSRRFAMEAAKVMAGNGIKVHIVKQATPTPVVAFGVKELKTAGAVMFTASHNPPEYNGIKYIPEYAGPATPEITKQLEENIAEIFAGQIEVKSVSIETAKEHGLFFEADPRHAYETHLKQLINFDAIREYPMSVAVDAMHGAGAGYVSKLLNDAGWNVIAMRESEDPNFGGSLPEPNEKHLQQLIQTLRDGRATLGLANDGDADRFGVVDENGNYITPNQVISLLALHLIRNRGFKGSIVRTVSTTGLLDRIAEKHGIELVETPVGFKYIGDQMMKNTVIIGGEESGGLSILGHIPEKDGILADLLIAELCAMEKKPLGEILKTMEAEFGCCYATRLDLQFAKKDEMMYYLRNQPPAKIGNVNVINRNQLDGVKLLLEDGSWVLVRPSGTEPLLRVYCEAPDGERFTNLVKDIETWLELMAKQL